MLLYLLIFSILTRIRNLRINEDIRDYLFNTILQAQKAERLGQGYRLNTCDHHGGFMISKTDVSICDYELLTKQNRMTSAPLLLFRRGVSMFPIIQECL